MTEDKLDFLYALDFNDPFPSGIFLIMDLESNVAFIQAASNISLSVESHFSLLVGGIHPHRDFQYAFDAHGLSKFTVVVLEYGEIEGGENKWLKRIKRSMKIINVDEAASEYRIIKERPSFFLPSLLSSPS